MARTSPQMNAQYDNESDVLAWLAGSGIVFIQVCALSPGLLPCLLLLLPIVLPLLALGLVAAIVVGVPLALWRAITRLGRRARARMQSGPSAPRLRRAARGFPA